MTIDTHEFLGDAAVLDFTSALYLGFWHATPAFPPWPRLTTGAPAALADPPGADHVAARLARLQGCETAVLGTSTLHVFWDVLGWLGRDGTAIYVDAGAYPIARWATLQAAVRGVPVRHFPHRDAAALRQLVEAEPRRRPIVLTDGVCVCCGASMPLRDYLGQIRPRGGLLVLDDTQALGVLGETPTQGAPYGHGGGGSLRHGGIRGPDIVVVASLAKALGVPVAGLSGSAEMVEQFKAASQTRVHCSPPSVAHIHAARHALDLNDQVGDTARQRLVERVTLFRQRLADRGLRSTGGLFPVQSLPSLPTATAQAVHQRLLAAGVQALLRGGNAHDAHLTWVLTARHRREAIAQAVTALAATLEPLVAPPEEPG